MSNQPTNISDDIDSAGKAAIEGDGVWCEFKMLSVQAIAEAAALDHTSFVHLKAVNVNLIRSSKYPISVLLLVDGQRFWKSSSLEANRPLQWDVSEIYVRSDSTVTFHIQETLPIGNIKTKLCSAHVSGKELMDHYGMENAPLEVVTAPRNKAMLLVDFVHRSSSLGGPDAVDIARSVMEGHQFLMKRIKTMVKFVGTLLNIGEPQAELETRGIATAVIGTLDLAHDAVEKSMASNDALSDLLESVCHILPYVKAAKDLSKLEQTKSILFQIVSMVDNVCKFVLQYVSKNFMMKVFTSNAEKEVAQLVKRFEQLKEDYEKSLAVEMLASVSEIHAVVVNVEEKLVLQELPIAPLADSWRASTYKCMENTRVDLLNELMGVMKKEESKLVWVTGLAGSGKTSIATSLAQELLGQGHVVAGFFCRRDDPYFRNAERIMPTLCHKLANVHKPFAEFILKALKKDSSLGQKGIPFQVQDLLIDPLMASEMGHVIIVVDALDECDKPLQQIAIFDSLVKLSQSVSNVHIVVTSRPNNLNKYKAAVIHKKLENYNAHDDILYYSKQELGEMVEAGELPEDWRGRVDPTAEQLAVQAGGLFIWIATAIEYLRVAFDVEESLKTLMDPSFLQVIEVEERLDLLYSYVLEQATAASQQNKDGVKRILQTVIAVSFNQPLPLSALAEIGQISLFVLTKITQALRAVIFEDAQSSNAVRVCHQSFTDFMVTEDRCGDDLLLDIYAEDVRLAEICLEIVSSKVKFNICGLKTSHKANADVEGLQMSIAQNISVALQYSSKYWLSHVGNVWKDLKIQEDQAEYIMSNVQDFFSGSKCLFWIEVLSLLVHVSDTMQNLQTLISLDNMNNEHKGAVAFMADCLRFLQANAQAIVQSTPHTYVSALTWMPKQSIMAKKHIQQFTARVKVTNGAQSSWTSAINSFFTGSEVNCVKYSPNGDQIACGMDNSRIYVLNVTTGAVDIECIGHEQRVLHLSFSPDGKVIASSSKDGTIRLWDSKTGELLMDPLKGHAEGVSAVVFSPNGKILASGSHDMTIRKWDPRNGAPLGNPIIGHERWIMSIAFSPDGKYIASASEDRAIRLWDAERGVQIKLPPMCHIGDVRSVNFSQDGRFIVSGAFDYTIRVWDIKTGVQVLDPMFGHTSGILCVYFANDGKFIASCSIDSTIRIWSVETGSQVGQLTGHTSVVESIAFSPDGRYITSAGQDRTVRIWAVNINSTSRNESVGHADCIRSISFSPDGKLLASAAFDRTIRFWDTENGHAVRAITASLMDWRAWQLEGGSVNSPMHSNRFTSVSFSPDGRYIVSGSDDKTVKIWDAYSCAQIGETLMGHSNQIEAVAYSPDGKYIASGSNDKAVIIWNAKTGTLFKGPLEGHTDWVMSVAFSPDGRFIASGSDDQTVRLWMVDTGLPALSPLTGHDGQVTSVAFSPDGQYIASASGDDTIRIWDIKSLVRIGAVGSRFDGGAITQPEDITVDTIMNPKVLSGGHDDLVQTVTFSPCGKYIASGSWDNTVRVWDVQEGTPIGGPLVGHKSRVFSVVFSPDGKYIASGSTDTTIRIWSVALALQDNRAQDELCTRSVKLCAPVANDGWVRSDSGDLLLWVPQEYRNGLFDHSLMSFPVDAADHPVELDCTEFVHGEEWVKIACVDDK